jgi:uncharacterized protein
MLPDQPWPRELSQDKANAVQGQLINRERRDAGFALFSARVSDYVVSMNKRIPVVLLVGSLAIASISLAADTPPTEASIKQLLEVVQAHKLIETTMTQMDGFMKKIMEQATEGQNLSPKIQKDIARRHDEMMSAVSEILDWNKLEPMYVRVYQKSFTQDEVNGMIAFYKTPTGQALLNKMPVVMQNTLNEVQEMIQPIMQRIQRMQQEVVAEIEADKNKG